MTDEQRVEAACAAYLKFDPLPLKSQERNAMFEALCAAYPELHGDSPSHWLAPWEASEEMLTAAENSPHGDSYHYAAPRHQWPAMRTAHLAKDQE